MEKEKTYQDKLKKLNPKKAIEQSRKYFSEKAYGEKLRDYSSRIGTKVVYYSLLLYYAFKSPATPKKAKLTIAGALGYLILPVDLIPDFIPAVGFADDSAVIIYAVYQVLSHIDDEVKGQAKARLKKLFGDAVNLDELEDPTEKRDNSDNE
ncbi:YkvA family protein [Halobacillus mangrovi]|uniref:YkvA family protein n=1 Tax=Halobacillus mangrovi TaxID=402384 RepID=UPI003D959C65